jgi:RHS repeat-associated protein
VTDPLNHTTTFQYDGVGNLLSITDPLNHQTTFTSNSAGQVATATDAMQNTIQFSYDAGDLIGITDPLGNSTTRFADNVGRLVSVTNALGRITKYTYNPLNQITQISDPLQGATNFTYDSNGNLMTVQDANQNTTTYTYNAHDMVATRTDPLQRTESYTYDTDENLTTFTDRKGQVTTYQYDNLNRLNFVGFGTQGNTYASTISYQYDSGNRMTQATDSISGIITRGYDGLDRLSSETTPQGSVGYTYDTASRRATMQVVGQTQVGYTFDNANRLTQIAQGTSTVGFTYDNSNRRSTLTLPSGIVATYSYDNDSHLAGISYTLNSTSVGALNYGYDTLGMRTAVSGSMARTGLPQPTPSASYDSGNELLAWNESALSYDSNGNMLSDGTHNYAWDARNHLSTIDSGSIGSFVYDPAGRRATKVISGTQTNFLYDLANPVQELSGTTPTANLLTGGLDQYFTRTDANGTANFLTDALGGTAAITDGVGTVQTRYTVDPFGNTVQSGTSSTNSFAYTGRENDGTGLYYYRARYYNPAIGRFVTEDPIGFASGQANLYAYVNDDPINGYDPFGLTDYNEQQTLELFLQPAYNDATAGYFQGLGNIFEHSRGWQGNDKPYGDYDFSQNDHRNDTFTRCGKKMTAGEFGNYMAGFEGGAWDDAFYGDREIGFSRDNLWQLRYAETAARAFGLFYHQIDRVVPGQTLAQNDPWDKTGFPWITLGADDGRSFMKGRGCGCR